MSNVKTSESHPLRIDSVRPEEGFGRIGITLCPGKTYPWGLAGNWKRDLDLDLDRVQRWGATAVVSLITEEEIQDLKVPAFPRAVADRHMEWWHLPIPDGQPPGPGFEKAWRIGTGHPGPPPPRLRRGSPLQGRTGSSRYSGRAPPRRIWSGPVRRDTPSSVCPFPQRSRNLGTGAPRGAVRATGANFALHDCGQHP